MKQQLPNRLRDQLIKWNVQFPLDREYRLKKNIIFGSEEHRQIDQIDLYLHFIEEKLFEEFREKAKDNVEREKEFEKGVWLRDVPVNEEEALDLFNSFNIADIPSDSPIQIEE